MKFIFALLPLLLLFGCSSPVMYESYLDVDIPETTANLYSDSAVSIHAKDLREQSEVVHYNLDSSSASRLANAVPVQKLLTERLASALEQQGLQFAADAPVTITLEINELAGVVPRPKILNKTEAKSAIRLIVNNRGTTLTKDYKRQAEQESVTLPDLWDVEMLLEEQVTEILELIINDEKMRSLIKKNK